MAIKNVPGAGSTRCPFHHEQYLLLKNNSYLRYLWPNWRMVVSHDTDTAVFNPDFDDKAHTLAGQPTRTSSWTVGSALQGHSSVNIPTRSSRKFQFRAAEQSRFSTQTQNGCPPSQIQAEIQGAQHILEAITKSAYLARATSRGLVIELYPAFGRKAQDVIVIPESVLQP